MDPKSGTKLDEEVLKKVVLAGEDKKIVDAVVLRSGKKLGETAVVKKDEISAETESSDKSVVKSTSASVSGDSSVSKDSNTDSSNTAPGETAVPVKGTATTSDKESPNEAKDSEGDDSKTTNAGRTNSEGGMNEESAKIPVAAEKENKLFSDVNKSSDDSADGNSRNVTLQKISDTEQKPETVSEAAVKTTAGGENIAEGSTPKNVVPKTVAKAVSDSSKVKVVAMETAVQELLDKEREQREKVSCNKDVNVNVSQSAVNVSSQSADVQVNGFDLSKLPDVPDGKAVVSEDSSQVSEEEVNLKISH